MSQEDREEALRQALGGEEEPEYEGPPRGKFKSKLNWGFWLLMAAFAWFIIDWFIWGPKTIGG